MCKIFTLKGRTQHGKNRVKEQGGKWELIKEMDSVIFSPEKGKWLLLKSKKSDTNIRWVNENNDKNFIVEKG